MKIAAITITFNRLDLTKQMVESFYSKTDVDYHLFIDNGSTDGTQEYLKQFDHIQLDKNYGIAAAFASAVKSLEGYDFILKLDNDIEVVTQDILKRMMDFFTRTRDKFVASPTDLLLDPNFAPHSYGKTIINGYQVEFVTHTGGAFQLIPIEACKQLVNQYRVLAQGDYSIGRFFAAHGYKPVYLRDFEMRHIGLNQSTPSNLYKL
jgi:GT2 family glycosyltransferase